MHSSRRLALAMTLAWFTWLAAQIALALTLRVEGYDGYWYFTNALYLLGGDVFRYEVTKAPLVSLLLLPAALLRRLGAPEVLSFICGHLTMLGLTTMLGVLVARLLRRGFDSPLAWAGAFAFLGSRLVSRYAVFAMSDLAAAAGVLLALLAVESAAKRHGWRARLPFATAVAIAITARYPAGLILPVAVAWDVAVCARSANLAAAARRFGHHCLAGLSAGGAIVLLHFVIYMVPFGSPAGVVAGFTDMVNRNARLGGISVRGLEPWWEYGPMLVLACTLPAVLLMVMGMVAAARHGGRREALHGLWVVACMGFVSLVSSHKEARYMLPALPSLFLFLLWGLRALRGLPGLRQDRRHLLLATAFLLAVGMIGLVRETRMMGQPFFRQPVQMLLAEELSAQAPEPARLAWAGNFYPVVPPRHVFTAADEYYYVYHLAPHVLEYYLGRPVTSLRRLQSALQRDVLYPLGSGTILDSGDRVISSLPGVTVTSTMEAPRAPLTLSTLSIWNLETVTRRDDLLVLQAPTDPVTARIANGRATVTCEPGVTEVVVRQRSGLSRSLGLHQAAQGSFVVDLPAGWHMENIDSMQVVHFKPQEVKFP